MWTLMVTMYQLQLFMLDTCDNYAVLVITSVPTLLYFIAASARYLRASSCQHISRTHPNPPLSGRELASLLTMGDRRG